MTAQQYLHTLITALVAFPDAVEITQIDDEKGTLLSVKIDNRDMPVIIGRGGKTIDSIRTIMRMYATKNNIRIAVKLIEE